MKRFLYVILLITLVCSICVTPMRVLANEPVWNEIWDPNMVDLVGYDGTKYYTPEDYWVVLYNEDGSTTYRETEGGVLQKRLRIVCYDDTTYSVYCIGAGLSYRYGGDKYYKEALDATNDYYARLPIEAQQGIYLSLLFGYEDGASSPVPDTNEDDYWLATQVLIWEYQQGLRKGCEDRQDNGPVRQDVYYEMIHNRPAERCYDWIVTQIRTYLMFPSFLTVESILYNENNVAVQKEKDGLYTLDLYDDNHTDAELVVLDGEGNVPDWVEIIHLNGSNYRLQATKPVNGIVSLWVQKAVPQGYKKLLYFSDGSGNTQVVMCRSAESTIAQELRPFNLSTKSYMEIGNIHITKYAETENLAFAFQIQGLDSANEHICEIVYTDSTGQGGLEQIPGGRYQIQEVLSDDSRWRQPEQQIVTVSDGMTSEVVFQNALKKGALTIYKTFEGRSSPWEGVCFEVTGVYQGEIVYQNRVATEHDGNCVLTELPVGQYVVRELPGDYAQWYEIGEPVSVEIEDCKTAEVYIHNQAKKTNLIIQKLGEMIHSATEEDGIWRPILRNEVLSEAVFEIYAEEDICAEDGTIRVQQGTLVDTVVWENEVYQSCLLYPGKYRLKESVCPEGYISCDDQIVILDLDQDNIVEIENRLKPTRVHFTKNLENGTPEQLNEVCFGLYLAEDLMLYDGTVLPKDSLLDKVYAQQDGTVELCTFFSGDTYVREIATPPGYLQDLQMYPVENGTIHDGVPLVNCLIPKNPKTGTDNFILGFAGVVILTVCTVGIIAFCRKSRYNI